MKALNIGSSSYEINSYSPYNLKEGEEYVLDQVYEYSSGIILNISMLLAKWGVESYLASGIGSDFYGERLKNELETSEVNTKYIETDYNSKTSLTFSFTNSNTLLKTKHHLNSEEKAPKIKRGDFDIEPNIMFLDGLEYHGSLNALNKFSEITSILYINKLNPEINDISKLVKYIMFSKNGAESITGIKIDINNSNTLINVYNQLFERYPNKNIFVIVDNLGIIYLSENTIKFMAGIKTKHIIKNDGIFIGGFGYGILNNFEIEKAIAYGNIATYLSDKESDTIKVIPNLNNVVAEYNNRYGKQPDIL